MPNDDRKCVTGIAPADDPRTARPFRGQPSLTTDAVGSPTLSAPSDDELAFRLLVGSPAVSAFREAFESATGLPVVLVARRLIDWGQGRVCTEICPFLKNGHPDCASCLRFPESHAVSGPLTQRCSFGLWRSAVPLHVNGTVAAFLWTGWIVYSRPASALSTVEDWEPERIPMTRDQIAPAHASARVVLTAYFVTSLAERLRQNERRLAAMADHALAGQQLLERALETTGTALRVLEADIQTSWANARWREWFERAGVDDGKGAAVLSGANAPARQTLADGQIRLTEVVVGGPAPRGQEGGPDRSYVFQITTAPLRESAGKVRQVVELAQDVTAQKQAQAQLMRAGQLAAVGELAGQVAHEVNNPIAIISAKARLLLADHHDEMSPKIAQELEKMTDLADRVARIAQGLLSYCRPSRARRERLDIRQPVRKCLAMVDRHARSSGIVIYDDLPAVIPDVNSNPQELEQVFLNLVINALDAMPTGGELRVSAATAVLADKEPGIAVSVADTGVGIEAEIRERIFEPFFTTKQEGCGTGLGLSIGLSLVRELGGDIEVESEPGKGSSFTVKLPAFTAKKGPSHG